MEKTRQAEYPGSPIPGMSYADAEQAVIDVMQYIADDLGLNDIEFDSIGYTIDVLFALGFRSHMLEG